MCGGSVDVEERSQKCRTWSESKEEVWRKLQKVSQEGKRKCEILDSVFLDKGILKRIVRYEKEMN